MAQRSSASLRYAEAVFQVAREQNSYDQWLRELGEVSRVFGDPLAARVLHSPAIPRERKSAILAEVIPDLGPETRRFVEFLLRRDRLDLVPQILESLQELIDQERGLQTVRVTTAVPLQPAERELISARLAARTGKQIRLEESVDPSVIGGVIAQVGDEIFDGSVRGRLNRLRRVLVEG